MSHAMRLAIFTCTFLAALSGVRQLVAEEAKPEKAASGELPQVYASDFSKGADEWEPTDKSAWEVKKTDAGHVYDQHKKNSNYKPPHRSPLNISLLKDVVVGDFVLTAKVLSTHPDYGHRDACLVFGYQDPANFYYVHLGKQTDDHANQIFIVDDKPRTKISTKTSKGTDWDDKWHDVKVVRDAGSGTIAVYFDEMTSPVMTAKDTTFTWGQIGLGTFDDTSQWRQIKLHGRKVEKK